MQTDPKDNNDRILAAIEKLDDRLRTFQEQIGNRFEELGDRFMPRPEILNRLAELGTQLAHQAADHQRLVESVDQAEQRRVTDRRWTFGALLASTAPLLTLSAFILAHWK